MRSDRRRIAARALGSLAAVLLACGGFHRGEPWTESTTTSGAATGGSEGDAPSFAGDVHPVLVEACGECHAPGASAGDTDLVLTGAADDDLGGVLDLVDPAAPASSRLLTKGAGTAHVGGAIIPAGSAEHDLILAWIAADTPP